MTNCRVFEDKEGVTENMTPEEKFEYLQQLGYIDKNEKFEDWTYSKKGGNSKDGGSV